MSTEENDAAMNEMVESVRATMEKINSVLSEVADGPTEDPELQLANAVGSLTAGVYAMSWLGKDTRPLFDDNTITLLSLRGAFWEAARKRKLSEMATVFLLSLMLLDSMEGAVEHIRKLSHAGRQG